MEIDDTAEELARSKLKTIITFVEGMKMHIEKDGRRIRDYKKVLLGQKYKVEDVLEQLENIITQLTLFVSESPTAAQVLDLDNLSGMRSETIKGDSLAWKRLHLYLLKLLIQNRYMFDYLKFEILRAELDANAELSNRWVLWEQKRSQNDLIKLGCIDGLVEEAVSLGSTMRGLQRKEDNNEPEFEHNPWAITQREVFMSGRVNQDNLDVLQEMADKGKEKIDRRVLFPGVTVVHLNEDDSQEVFQAEHKSRNTLHNITFKLKLDAEMGRHSAYSREKDMYGTLKTCMDLHKLMDGSPEYRNQALITRFVGKIEHYYKEKDPALDQDIHYVVAKQIHPKYDLIMDWQYKVKFGKEPEAVGK